MGKKDPRVDAYIKRAAPFAQPILTEFRSIVHGACPGVEETMKWSFPHFDYKGVMCSMAAFKAHAAFAFWKGSLVTGGPRREDAMGHFGRITKRSDLPSKAVLAGFVKKAAALNDQGVKVARAPKRAPKPVKVPAALSAALEKSQQAQRRLRRAESQPPARIHRVDHRGEDRCDAHAPADAGDRVDGGGQVAELEI